MNLESWPPPFPAERNTYELPPPDPRYAEYAARDLGPLCEIFRHARAAITFGPRYTGKTELGLPVRIISPHINIDLDGQLESSGDFRSYFLLASGADGTLLGHRWIDVQRSKPEGARAAVAEGQIVTRFRNSKIAPAIEIANLDILQREADSLGPEGVLTWKITNRNQIDMAMLLLQSADADDKERIRKIKQAEQQRWQHLYGEYGLVGALSDRKKFGGYTRTFAGRSRPAPPADEVEFHRKEGFFLTTAVEYNPRAFGPEDLKDSRQENEMQLERIMSLVESFQAAAI